MDKRTDLVKSISVGGRDAYGNKVVDVLAFDNEFAIYEIDHVDPSYRLRVIYDGCTEESEKLLIERLSAVKEKYIEAKSLLYKSGDYGTMKYRIAEILWTSLLSDNVNGNKAFDNLIDKINSEFIISTRNRISYLFPGFVQFAVVLLLFISVYLLCYNGANMKTSIVDMSFVFLVSASSGNVLSSFLSARSVRFNEYPSFYYLIFGCERVIISYAASVVCGLLIKSQIIFGNIGVDNFWAAAPILVVAAFSEAFIPSIIAKIEEKTKNA